MPANGWTWTEFMDTLEVIRQWYDANGRQEQYLLDSYFNWEAVYNPIFRSFGADLITEDGQAQVDTEEVSEALNFMYDLIEKRYVAPLDGQVQAGYHFGQGCMLFNSAPAERLYEELGAQNFRYNLTTFPLVTDELSTSYIGSGVGGYGISSISKNRDLAWAFLRFMISRDGQNALARGGLTTPSIRKDMENPAANVWGSALMEEGINMEAYTYGTEQCIVTDFFLRPGKSKIYADLQEAITLLVGDALSGTRSQIGKTMEEIQLLTEDKIAKAR